MGTKVLHDSLQKIKANTLVIGIDSDLLFPISEQKQISDNIPHAQLEIIHSHYGNDAFLIETDKLKLAIHQFFEKDSKYILQ